MEKRDLKFKVQEIAKEIGGIERVSLFGSYFRGEETVSSDIDIIVKLVDSYDSGTFFDFQTKLEEILGLEVDLLNYDTVSETSHLAYLIEDTSSEIVYGE